MLCKFPLSMALPAFWNIKSVASASSKILDLPEFSQLRVKFHPNACPFFITVVTAPLSAPNCHDLIITLNLSFNSKLRTFDTCSFTDFLRAMLPSIVTIHS